MKYGLFLLGLLFSVFIAPRFVAAEMVTFYECRDKCFPADAQCESCCKHAFSSCQEQCDRAVDLCLKGLGLTDVMAKIECQKAYADCGSKCQGHERRDVECPRWRKDHW